MHKPVIHHFKEVTSTMDVARHLYNDGKGDGTVVLAEYQTKGRGRPGRTWQSEKGKNFLATLIFQADSPLPFTVLPFLISLSLIEALGDYRILGLSLKWPNDLLLHKKKLGGILIEKIDEQVFAIGIGINLEQAPDDLAQDMLFPPTCLMGVFDGELPSKEALVTSIFAHLNANESLYYTNGFESVREKWMSHHLPIGTLMSVKLSQNRYQGIYQGLTTEGHLTLALQDGTHKTFATGDVFVT